MSAGSAAGTAAGAAAGAAAEAPAGAGAGVDVGAAEGAAVAEFAARAKVSLSMIRVRLKMLNEGTIGSNVQAEVGLGRF